MTAAEADWRPIHGQAQHLFRAGRPDEALAALEPVLAAHPVPLEVVWLAAAVHEALGQTVLALQRYEQVAAAMPANVGVQNAIGRVHANDGRPEAALALFDEVLRHEPDNVEALFNRGNALRMLYRREEAVESYRRVLPLHAGYANLALLEIGRQQQDLLDLDGARIAYLQHYLTSGGSLESIAARLSVEHCTWPPDPEAIAVMAREMGEAYAARLRVPSLPPPPARTERLRVGLVSADLWSHPVGYFTESLLASSAARDVDWLVYAHRAPRPDPVTERLRPHTTAWHDVATWPDERLARQIRLDGVDVLVDLSGHSAYSRLSVFSARPAPLQLSWLGYHGTTGLPFVDAVIADPVCVRPGEEHFFTEPLIRLPHTRFCYSPQPGAPPVASAPSIASEVVTFGCFQHGVKIGPAVLAAWARIAAALPEARWVVADATHDVSGVEAERLRRRLLTSGFSPEHLEIRGRRGMADYLAGYADVDLMLDTFPFTGGTTTAEALWQGVPTLTLSSPGMIGRQGEQILRASGLGEWVTHSVDEYVDQAIARGREAPHAAWTRQRPTSRARLRTTPFFDAERFGRDWLTAVCSAWERRTEIRPTAGGS